MTCIEFQDILPDVLEGEADAAHAAHLMSCPSCSELVSDLRAIASGAKLLCGDDEPSPRVWANIQRTLEAEGIIRPATQPGAMLFPQQRKWFSPAWLTAAAAIALIAVGAFFYSNRGPTSIHPQLSNNTQAAPLSPGATEDDDLALLGQMSPAERAFYADDLQTVNNFIRDAETTVAQNPEDDDARHFLMDAYQQRAMVYSLAMDRSVQ